MDQFQTAGVVLASDWCHKTFVFLCPITEQQDYESFRVFLNHTLLAICLLEEESSNHSAKCGGDRSAYPQETRRKYAGPFAGIATLAFLTD